MVLINSIDAPAQAGGKFSKTVYASYTRHTGTTAYSAGDIVSDTEATAKAIVFPGCGRSGKIQRVHLAMEHTVTADWELCIFDAEPTNFADNAVLALVSADMLKLLSICSLGDAGKKALTTVGDGISHYKGNLDVVGNGEVCFTATDGKLYGLLVTRSAFTPVASCKFHIRLHIEQDWQ